MNMGIKMNERKTIALLPKKKRGLLRIVFSRFGLMALLILVEIVILFSIFRWFGEYFGLFTAFQTVFSVGMILYLFQNEMDSSVKLTWLILIMLFPVPATLLLWLSNEDVGHRITKRRIAHLIEETGSFIQQDQEVLKREELVKSGTDDLCRYLNRTGCFPIYENTEVQYFPLGEDKFRALLEELEKAEKFIFMEYFIIDEGYMWGAVLKVLAEKAAKGVDVRVLYDGMCEATLLTHDYPRRMAKLGISCKPFTPISPFISTQYNYRDHRKILVIDGKVAFNGGVNLADEYINRKSRFGHWKDTAVMLKGEAVRTFTLMFLQMWNLDEKEPKWAEVGVNYKNDISDGYVMPYGDCPLDDEKVGEKVYMDILYRAKSYVHIMTPYLILDDELKAALIYAAQRGVDVKIILPGIPDKKLAYALAKTHYKTLVNAGVKLYEYTPGFVHAKVFVSDDEKAVVGTINLDYRSLYHHFECATYLYHCKCIRDIETDFNDTLAKCRMVTGETIKNEKLYYKVMGVVLKAIAPLM